MKYDFQKEISHPKFFRKRSFMKYDFSERDLPPEPEQPTNVVANHSEVKHEKGNAGLSFFLFSLLAPFVRY